jgi:hypothetical protein
MPDDPRTRIPADAEELARRVAALEIKVEALMQSLIGAGDGHGARRSVVLRIPQPAPCPRCGYGWTCPHCSYQNTAGERKCLGCGIEARHAY